MQDLTNDPEVRGGDQPDFSSMTPKGHVPRAARRLDQDSTPGPALITRPTPDAGYRGHESEEV